MDFKKIQNDIKKGDVAPFYLLYGEESFFIDQITDCLEEHVLTEDEKAFNLFKLYGRDSDLIKILSVAKGFPMIGERQLVIVKEAQDLKEFKKKKEDKKKKENSEEGSEAKEDAKKEKSEEDKKKEEELQTKMLKHLEHYLQEPSSMTILVFAFKSKGPDGRLKATKLMKKAGVTFESKKIYENQVPRWINNYLKSSQQQNTIANDACHLLSEYLGNNLSKLTNALDKLAVVVPGAKITTSHIDQYIGISKDYNVFALQDAFATRDLMRTNKIIAYFSANPKNHPLPMILAVLYGFFSKALVQKTSKAPDYVLVESIKANKYALQGSRVAVPHYSAQKLASIISYIREADRIYKGVEQSSLSEGAILKEMTFKILH